MNRTIFALALLLSLGGCATSNTRQVCLGTDLTSTYANEPIASAEDACSAVRNVIETRFIALGCGPPPNPSTCPYLTSAMARFPQHVWLECVESIRLATTCGEVLDRQALCWCVN